MTITRSAEIGALVAALAKAQKAMKPPVKDKVGKIKGQKKDGSFYEYEYRYSDLASLIDAIRGPFADNGLAYTQLPVFEADTLVLRTVIAHESGQWMEGSYPCGLGEPQKVGIALTYARRYSLQSMAGLASEDDPDGRHGTQSGPKSKPAPAPKQPSGKPAEALPLSEEEQHKLANWELGLETKHSPEDIARARKNASVLTSAALKAAVMDAIERHAKKAAA